MELRILTYNIRNARGVNNKVSLKRVASTIKSTGAQIAGLQEVDYLNPRSWFVHQASKLGKMLGMDAIFGPNVTWGRIARFGNAILSCYPILSYKNYLLPSVGEQRGILRSEISIKNQRVLLYNTHLGLDHKERLQQVDRIIDIIACEDKPLILVGDFNAGPDAEEIQRIQALLTPSDPTGRWLTFPSTAPKFKIDYIFFSRHWQLNDVKVYASEASDHLPLVASLTLIGDIPSTPKP